jgi:pilus assembly protein CpaF
MTTFVDPGSSEGTADEADVAEVERRLWVLQRSIPVRAPAASTRSELERLALPRFLTLVGSDRVSDGEEGRRVLERQARTIVEQLRSGWIVEPRPSARDVEIVARSLVDQLHGLGPVQPLLEDASVSEIMVNGPDTVLVERAGQLVRTDVRFRDTEHLIATIRRIAERIGRRVDFASPTLDGRLEDGSRVHAVLPPVALDGPILTIRKFGMAFTQLEDLVLGGSLSMDMAYFLAACVKARLNIAIGGPASSGKTTTMNVLASLVPSHERIVTIEELAELDMSKAHDHVVRLEARPENIEGRGEITIRQLVREALRMRADRIIVGEARGAEMMDVLQAMRCGHDGSMTTIHASSAEDLIERGVTIALFANLGLADTSVRRMVVDGLDLIVMLFRFGDGRRKVTRITEPYWTPDGRVAFNDVFAFEYTGHEADTRVRGDFRRIGTTRFAERFRRLAIPLPDSISGRDVADS